jgi:hypothetical protein
MKSKFSTGRLKLVKRTHTITKKNPQHNQTWEWEETPELKAYIAKQTGNKVLLDGPKTP